MAPSQTKDILSLMTDWHRSWAGVKEDTPIGQGVMEIMRPFIEHLQDKGLAPKTIRRHLDNCWVIGGEVIRELGYDATLRSRDPKELLLNAIDCEEAPLIHGASESEQRSCDATARKLLKFIRSG